MQELLGVDSVDEIYDAKTIFTSNKIEVVLGSRIGRRRNSSLTAANEK